MNYRIDLSRRVVDLNRETKNLGAFHNLRHGINRQMSPNCFEILILKSFPQYSQYYY